MQGLRGHEHDRSICQHNRGGYVLYAHEYTGMNTHAHTNTRAHTVYECLFVCMYVCMYVILKICAVLFRVQAPQRMSAGLCVSRLVSFVNCIYLSALVSRMSVGLTFRVSSPLYIDLGPWLVMSLLHCGYGTSTNKYQ